ncbi:MAG: tetratricopeptide repeat protein, partial [Acidobacteriota bacterium]
WTFWGSLDAGFVDFDDDLYVTAAPWTDVGLTVDGVIAAFDRFYASNWHPLTVLSHQLDVELFGLDARWHHLVNVLWHLANALLLFGLLRSMTGATWRSLLVAALFAVHPLRVESVTWVAERKDVLSTCLALLTVIAYRRWIDRRKPADYALVAVLFASALMAKAMVVTLPCALLLLDLWPLRRLDPSDPRSWIRPVVEKVPLLAMASAVSWATVGAQGTAMTASGDVSFGHRLANAATATVGYVEHTLWPSGLAVFYPYPSSIPTSQWVISAVVLAGLTVIAAMAWRRAPWWTTGWLWFLGTLVPVIGLLRVGEQAMADRYTYWPSIGLTWAIVWSLDAWLDGRFGAQGRRAGAAVGLIVVGLLSSATRAQVEHWRDSETLWRRALAVTTDNELAHTNLAEVLRTAGRPAEAIEHYRAAMAIRPDLALVHAGLAHALRATGDVDGAIESIRSAVSIDRDDLRFRHLLAAALAERGQHDEAATAYRELLDRQPDAVVAYLGLGDLAVRQGDWATAIVHYRAAVDGAPDRPDLRGRLALLLERQGRLDEAVAELERVLVDQPEAIEARRRLGSIHRRRGDLIAARDHLGTAFAAEPTPGAALVLAAVLVELGDVETAENVLSVAIERFPSADELVRAHAALSDR